MITEAGQKYISSFDVAHSSCFSYIEDQLGKIKATGIPLVFDFSDVWTEDTFKNICPDISIAFFSGKEREKEALKEQLEMCVKEYGCEMAVTTIGGRGAVVYNGRKFYEKLPYNFEGGAIDTTGAGDSWITAFLSSYYANDKKKKGLILNHEGGYYGEWIMRITRNG